MSFSWSCPYTRVQVCILYFLSTREIFSSLSWFYFEKVSFSRFLPYLMPLCLWTELALRSKNETGFCLISQTLLLHCVMPWGCVATTNPTGKFLAAMKSLSDGFLPWKGIAIATAMRLRFLHNAKLRSKNFPLKRLAKLADVELFHRPDSLTS